MASSVSAPVSVPPTTTTTTTTNHTHNEVDSAGKPDTISEKVKSNPTQLSSAPSEGNSRSTEVKVVTTDKADSVSEAKSDPKKDSKTDSNTTLKSPVKTSHDSPAVTSESSASSGESNSAGPETNSEKEAPSKSNPCVAPTSATSSEVQASASVTESSPASLKKGEEKPKAADASTPDTRTRNQEMPQKLSSDSTTANGSASSEESQSVAVNTTAVQNKDTPSKDAEVAPSSDSKEAEKMEMECRENDIKRNNNKVGLEDGEEPEKKAKMAVEVSSKGGGKTPEQILGYMDKTFEQRRKVIMKQMPTIPELKEMCPDLFMGKQLLIEFQRITKIDIDQRIQEFCVRYATAVIEMARNKKGAAPVLARWEQAKQENEVLKQYWDMVTALCLLPLHFGENFVEMVLEIDEDEEVKAQGKIVPTLVARGNIFRTDEFFLIAENTIVQEFEEFTIAFASLYSSYWVFNMVYPETIENTYNYIQRCIVRQREPGSIPAVCKNFTKSLQKWNKAKEGK